MASFFPSIVRRRSSRSSLLFAVNSATSAFSPSPRPNTRTPEMHGATSYGTSRIVRRRKRTWIPFSLTIKSCGRSVTASDLSSIVKYSIPSVEPSNFHLVHNSRSSIYLGCVTEPCIFPGEAIGRSSSAKLIWTALTSITCSRSTSSHCPLSAVFALHQV